MSTFLKSFGPDVAVDEVDLDVADVRCRGEKLTEARAEQVAAEVLARMPGRPSLSGARETSPSLTIPLPKQERARLDLLAAERGGGHLRSCARRLRTTSHGTPAEVDKLAAGSLRR